MSCASADASEVDHGRPSERRAPWASHHAGGCFGPSLRLRSNLGASDTSTAQPSPPRQPLLASRLAADASASAPEPQMSGLPAAPAALTAVARNADGRSWVWPIAPAHEPFS